MTDDEKIRSFADMVDAVEKLTKPIQEENMRLHAQIDKIHKDRFTERIIHCIVSGVLGAALIAFIAFAYMTPMEVEQQQDFTGQTQTQGYSEGVAKGD